MNALHCVEARLLPPPPGSGYLGASMVIHTPGVFLPPAKPPLPGARVLVVELDGRVTEGRVHRDPHHLTGGPATFVGQLWHLLLPRTEGIEWARGCARKTRDALEAMHRLSESV